jgi:hypothetical protein
LRPGSDISASSQFGVDGTISINTELDVTSGLVDLSSQAIDPNSLIYQGCEEYQGSSFIITGRGGLPLDPTQGLESSAPWQDLRLPSQYFLDGLPSSQRPDVGKRPKQLTNITNMIENQLMVEATVNSRTFKMLFFLRNLSLGFAGRINTF